MSGRSPAGSVHRNVHTQQRRVLLRAVDVGVADVATDWRVRTGIGNDIPVFAATEEAEAAMRAAEVPLAGRLEDLLGQVDAVVDTTPKGVAATNLDRYRTAGVKAVLQGGEYHVLGDSVDDHV